MHNEETQNQLLLYFYNELDDAKGKQLLEHIKNCALCKMRLEELKNLSLFVGQNKKSPPQAIVNDIYCHIRQAKKPAYTFTRRFYKPAIAFAGAMLVILVFNFFKKPSLPEDLWFEDIYSRLETLHSDISEINQYFASSDYIMQAKIDELEELVGNMEISDI